MPAIARTPRSNAKLWAALFRAISGIVHLPQRNRSLHCDSEKLNARLMKKPGKEARIGGGLAVEAYLGQRQLPFQEARYTGISTAALACSFHRCSFTPITTSHRASNSSAIPGNRM